MGRATGASCARIQGGQLGRATGGSWAGLQGAAGQDYRGAS